MSETPIGRRTVAVGGAAWLVTSCVTPLEASRPSVVAPAPFRLSRGSACARGAVGPTPQIAEGPFYRPRTPRTVYLGSPDEAGERFVLVGRVLDHACRPVEGAALDFWQADAGGVYDTNGNRFRGHQFTARDGLYRLSTVRPGPESVIGFDRTPHIHVKVQAPGGGLLTTQLYFAGETQNSDDLLFDARCLLEVDADRPRPHARFDFVLPAW